MLKSTSNNANNGIQIFNNTEIGEVRVIVNNGEPLFCLTDVCEILELTATKVATRLTDDVLSKHPIADALGRMQQTNFVNEDGLYDVILDSRKPEAKKFRKWVTAEVLPLIRKTGMYATNEDDLILQAMQVLNNRLQIANATNEKQEQVIKELAPKADYYDAVLQSTATYTTTQIAKEFGMSAGTFHKRLSELNIMFKQSGQWQLYAKYQDKGYTATRTHKYYNTLGMPETSMITVWTETGRQYLHSRAVDILTPEHFLLKASFFKRGIYDKN